jgi:hypothetical protein
LSKGGARHGYLRGASRTKADEEDAHKALEKFWAKRRTEVLRRVVEVLLLLGLGHIVYSGDGRITGSVWERGSLSQTFIAAIAKFLQSLHVRLSLLALCWFSIQFD